MHFVPIIKQFLKKKKSQKLKNSILQCLESYVLPKQDISTMAGRSLLKICKHVLQLQQSKINKELRKMGKMRKTHSCSSCSPHILPNMMTYLHNCWAQSFKNLQMRFIAIIEQNGKRRGKNSPLQLLFTPYPTKNEISP